MGEKSDNSQGDDIEETETGYDEAPEVPNEYERYRDSIVARNRAFLEPAIQASKEL